MLDQELATAARRNHGVLTTTQLRRLGVSEHELSARLRSGALERRHQKVVVVAGAPRTWHQDAAVALAALPGSVLGHESAARIDSLYGFKNSTVISLLAPLDAHQRLQGVRVRRTGRLPHRHVTTTDGLSHTTRARTCIDLAVVVRDARLQRLIEDELTAHRMTWDELESTFVSIARRGRPGIARARRVLTAIEGEPPTESRLERMYLDILRHADVAPPRMQVTAPWADREPGRVDAMYVEARSIIELDGRTFHQRTDAFERDHRRDQLATLHHHRTVRFTYRQITGDPDHVVAMTRFLSRPAT